MHRTKKIGGWVVCLVLVLPSIMAAGENISPVDVFEQTWQVFNTNYPYFAHHGVDWDAIHRVYRPQVTEQTTDEELFGILSRMLGHLNDGHVNLSNGQARFNAGVTQGLKMEDFSETLIRTKYLKNRFEARQDSNLVYAWLPDSIGYLRIRGWKQKERVGAIMDSILAELKTAKGMIIDVRANGGGNAFAAQAIAGRFADRIRLYAKNYPKRGPGHDSLFPPTYLYVEPAGPVQYTGPVVVLQHKFSESATEEFILAMRVLPHVTLIGETTGGCFGNYYPDKLANGWTIGMAWSYEVDQNDQCWVGIGIQPELQTVNSNDDMTSERDRVLEFGIELIAKGGQSGHEFSGSQHGVRRSLFRQFVRTAEERGIETAVKEFQRLQTEEPDSVYFSIQECMNGARSLMETGKLDVLTTVMELAHNTWPDAIALPWILGKAYEQQGQPEKAAAAYRLIAEREAYFPWDKSSIEEARQFLAARQ